MHECPREIFEIHFLSPSSLCNQVKQTNKQTNICYMHSLKRLKNFLPPELKRILVHFDYCDILLTELAENLSDKLQHVHNMCIRYIFNTRCYEHISPSFEDLSWLRFNDRRTLHSLVLLFQILRTSSPNYLASRFHFLSSNHNLSTRSQHILTLSIPYHRTSLYSTSSSVSSSRCWNSLPLDIRGCRTLASFKRLVNNLLLCSVKNWFITL